MIADSFEGVYGILVENMVLGAIHSFEQGGRSAMLSNGMAFMSK